MNKPPTFHDDGPPAPAASRPTDTLLERLIAVKIWLETSADALTSHPDYNEETPTAWACEDIVAQLKNVAEDVAYNVVFAAQEQRRGALDKMAHEVIYRDTPKEPHK